MLRTEPYALVTMMREIGQYQSESELVNCIQLFIFTFAQQLSIDLITLLFQSFR